jgi:hypothetical protein
VTEPSKRRTVLEGIAFGRESTETARLKALELLERLDEREGQKAQPPEPIEPDVDKLARVLEMMVEYRVLDAIPAFGEIVEARALEIVEERALAARSTFATVEATEEPQPVEEVGSKAPDLEAATEPEDAPERPDPLLLSPEVLARQWPHRRRGLRDVRESTILRPLDLGE